MESPLLTVDGRLLVAMIDVLAMVRIDADAEVLLLQCHDDQPGSGDDPWTARLWSLDAGPSSPVASILAMSFASFVGQP